MKRLLIFSFVIAAIFAFVAVGGIVTVQPNDTLQQAQQKMFNSAINDTIDMSGYSAGGELLGVNYRRYVGAWSSKVSRNQWALRMPNPMAGVIFDESFKLSCPDGGGILAPGPMSDSKFTKIEIGPFGYYGAIRAMGTSTNVLIAGSYFHDGLSADRTIDLWSDNNVTIQQNDFFRVHDAGHLDGVHQGLFVLQNKLEQVHRSAFEVQDHGSSRTNPGPGPTVFDSNVAFEFYQPSSWTMSSWPDSFTKKNWTINNYMCLFASSTATAPTGGWGTDIPGGNPSGYPYEYDLQPGGDGRIENNIAVGPWSNGFVVEAAAPGPIAKNNIWYHPNKTGSGIWAFWNNNLGSAGRVQDQGGNTFRPINEAPTPQQAIASRKAGRAYYNGGTGGATQPAQASVTVSAITATDAAFSVSNVPSGATVAIQIITSSGEKIGNAVSLNGATKAVLTNLPSGWHLKATPVVNGADGTTSAEFQMLGTSGGYPYSGPPPALKGTVTQPPPDQPTTTDHDLIINVTVQGQTYPVHVIVKCTATGARTVTVKP